MSATHSAAPVGVPKNLLGGNKAGAQAPVTSILDLPPGTPDPGNGPALPGVPVPKPTKVKAKGSKAPAPAAEPIASPDPVTVPDGPGVSLLGAKGTSYAVTVPQELLTKIVKPVTGMGGWQRVMLELQAVTTALDMVNPETGAHGLVGTVTLTPYLLNRLITLSVKHGSGGYQAVIRHLVCLALAQFKTAILGGTL